MINKVSESVQAALAQVESGMSIAVGGFGASGVANTLIDEIMRRDLKDLHVISNNGGTSSDPHVGAGRLILEGRVRKITCSFPASKMFLKFFDAGDIELELVPQGTLAERLRAGGAGIGAFYTPTSAGTDLAEGRFPTRYDPVTGKPCFPERKESRVISGRLHVLEFPILPDVALIKAHVGDRFGNLRFRNSAQNFNLVCGMAAKLTVAEVEVVRDDALDPNDIQLPGIFVHGLVPWNGEDSNLFPSQIASVSE